MTQARCIVDSIRWIGKGDLVDIAYVYEFPKRVMVKKDDGSWPIPSDERFGWDEYFFDARGRAIEIRSCGYHLRLVDEYGVYLTEQQLSAWQSYEERDEDWPFEVPRPGLVSPMRYDPEHVLIPKLPDGMAGTLGYDMWRLSRLGSIQLAKDIVKRMCEVVGIRIADDAWQPIDHEEWVRTWYTAAGQISFRVRPDGQHDEWFS